MKMPLPGVAGKSSPVALAAIVLVAGLAGACARPDVPTAAELNRAYDEALAQSAPLAVDYSANPQAQQAVLDRLAEYFASMTPASVREHTARIYAPDAVLYDNLAVVTGVAAIEEYFVKATTEADGLKVEFRQISNSGYDYYIRWEMAIESEALSPDAPIVSYGVTHFRFDDNGRVLLHRDFWDASTGLYEYLPWVGALLERLRAALS